MVVYNIIKNTNPSAKSGVIGSTNTGKVKLQHTVTVDSANCLLKYADSDLCYSDCYLKKFKNAEYCLSIRNNTCDEDCLEKYKSIDYCTCIKKGKNVEKCKKIYLTEHFNVPIDYDELKTNIKKSVIIVLLSVLIISYFCKKKIFG